MTLLTVRLALVAACGGFAAYTDARIHKIPDLAWILGLGGQASSRRSAGRQRGSAERAVRWPWRWDSCRGYWCGRVACRPSLLATTCWLWRLGLWLVMGRFHWRFYWLPDSALRMEVEATTLNNL